MTVCAWGALSLVWGGREIRAETAFCKETPSTPRAETMPVAGLDGRRGPAPHSAGAFQGTTMTESGLPLAGLRVLDISSFIAAPAAAVVLGDWAADGIKTGGPDGDANRRILHDSSNYPKGEVNYPWQMDSRNKRSLVLDLKQPPARAALDRLIATSDVLVCNFPPPVRDKLRLTYDDVKRVNPKLVYASLTGYGETGPDPDRPGFDSTPYFTPPRLLDPQPHQ